MPGPGPEDNRRNIRIVIEYDGSGYRGWQVQPNEPTVQEALESAVERITGERSRVSGAGRTDAGVHALGQVAHFFTSSQLPAPKITAALNGVLPPDIVVLRAEEAGQSFHARFSARRKRYRYTILNRDAPSALERSTALFVPVPLDLEAMREAGRFLKATRDFSSFACNAGRDDDPVRTVTGLSVERKGEFVVIEVEAVSFLYKMVRSIAGTLLDVGKGKTAPRDIGDILDARDRSRAGATAPAHGLCLVEVVY